MSLIPSSNEFGPALEKSHDTPVIALFSAGWCSSCGIMKPVMKELAAEADGKWLFEVIDVEEHVLIAAQYNVSKIPDVKIFYQGDLWTGIKGTFPARFMEKWLNENLPNGEEEEGYEDQYEEEVVEDHYEEEEVVEEIEEEEIIEDHYEEEEIVEEIEEEEETIVEAAGEVTEIVEEVLTLNPINKDNSTHYEWGQKCSGWHLLQSDHLSIIEELMPPNAAEQKHFHDVAEQFFFVLAGQATFEVEGASVTVSQGEGLHIEAKKSHQIQNLGGEDLRFLLVSHPSTKGDRVEV